MAESDNIKEVINQVVVQVAMAVMMALRDTEAGPHLSTAVSHRQSKKKRYGGPVLVKLVFNWGMQEDRLRSSISKWKCLIF